MRMCQKKTQNAIGLLDCSQAPAPLIFSHGLSVIASPLGTKQSPALNPQCLRAFVATNPQSAIRNPQSCPAFTLIEMLVVIAIIAILISMVIGLGARFDNQGKERLTRETIGIISNALEQFRDFRYEYKDANFAGLVFPLDFNDFNAPEYHDTLMLSLGLWNMPTASIDFIGLDPNGFVFIPLANVPAYAGCEAMYFFLSQVPQCRQTLDKIDKSLVTAAGTTTTGFPVTRALRITVNNVPSDSLLYRITDPWGTTLRYDYYDERWPNHAGTWAQRLQYRDNTKNTFPVITSAGPDRSFNTADDISNRQEQ